VNLNTWHAARAALMDVATLSEDGHGVSLVRWRPGASVPPHAHRSGEEILVLEGELRSGEERYPAGTWLRLHPDSTHAPFATTRTLILLRNGHLRSSGLARVA
jgi:anti-sigma factor ChrR (cupin superfamily)